MSPRSDDTAVGREVKGFRIDLVIAMCALLVSSLATGAAWWQSRVVAQQLSSQVWPYLSVQSTVSGNAVSLTIANEGLGPARVRYVVVSLDGVPRRYLTDVIRTLLPGTKAVHGSFSDLTPGNVIRVGGTVTLFRITDPPIVKAFVTNYQRFAIDVCYCPIIPGNCWLAHHGANSDADADPEVVSACPDRRRDALLSGVAP